MLESALERKCGQLAKSHGCLFIKNQGTRGFPDRTLVLPNGTVVFIEFKRPDGKGVVSKLQEYYMKQLQDRGCHVYVIDDYSVFKLLLEAWV